jgi:hypothetical protein
MDFGTCCINGHLKKVTPYRRRIAKMLRDRSVQKELPIVLCSPTDIGAISLINVNGTELLYSDELWVDLLDIAARFGWVPEGTSLAGAEVYQSMCGYQPVSDGKEGDEKILKAISHFLHFEGGYVPQSPYDRIFIEDAWKMADALELFLRSTPADNYMWLPLQYEGPEKDSDLITHQRKILKDFIEFARGGGAIERQSYCKYGCQSCSGERTGFKPNTNGGAFNE